MAIPSITGLNPAAVPENTTININISGTNFDTNCTVWIDGDQCPVVQSTAQQITATFTSDEYPGPIPVIVSNLDGSSRPWTLQVTAARGEVVTAAAAGTKEIGILSSIEFTGTSFESWFRLGLGRPASIWDFNTVDNLGYKMGPLQSAAQIMSGTTDPDVIVTFGGNIVATAMANNNPNNLPFFPL